MVETASPARSTNALWLRHESRPTVIAAAMAAVLWLPTSVSLAEPPAGEQTRPDTAVTYAVGLQLGVAPEVAAAIANELATRTRDALCRPATAPAQLSLPGGCASSPACIQDIGKRQASERVAVLAVVGTAQRIRLDIQLFDSASGERISRQQTEYASDDQGALGAAIPPLLAKLLAAVPAACPAEPVADPAGAQVTAAVPHAPADGGRGATTTSESRPTEPASGAPRPSPVPTPAEAAARTAPSHADSARNLTSTEPSDRRSRRTWLWAGVGAATVAVVATSIYFATRDDLPSLTLPPPRE